MDDNIQDYSRKTCHAVEIRASDHFRFLFNFNVPVAIVQGDDANEYRNVLQRIANYIFMQFFPRPENCVSCRFQVTATYILKKPYIDDERQWTGSFQNMSNNNTVLSGPGMQDFFYRPFVNFVYNCTREDNIMSVLDWQDLDTQWKFDRLTSVIVSFQVLVKISDDRVHRALGFGHTAANGRRQSRYRRFVQIHDW